MLTTTKDSIDSAAYNLPCYWKQGRFLQDRMLHPEASVQPNGYAAEHLAYSMKGDDAINITVIACCLVIMILIRKTRTFLSGQTHDFFLPTHQEKNLQGTTTAIERSMPLFLVIILGILGSMLFYYYRQEVLGTRMPGNMPPHPLMFACAGCIYAYFLFRHLLYTFVNWVFFDKINRQQWYKASNYILYLETLAVLPVTLMCIYLDLSPVFPLSATALILISAKILLIIKTYQIFFPKLYGILHLLSYLCALEAIPLLALWGAMNGIADALTV